MTGPGQAGEDARDARTEGAQEQAEDLELDERDSDRITGGTPSVSDITITKQTDTSTPGL